MINTPDINTSALLNGRKYWGKKEKRASNALLFLITD